MLTLILTAWLTLPLAPLNPLEQDTVSAMNLHFNAGIGTPSRIMSSGPVVSSKWEVLAMHPVILRGTLDYRYGHFRSEAFENLNDIGDCDGKIHQFTLAGDALYYRGTNKLTGYLGLGVLFTYASIRLSEVSRELLEQHNIDRITIKPELGYRLILGLRYLRIYSLEISITEVEPDFVLSSRTIRGAHSETTSRTDFSGFQISLGYLWTLKDIW
ncbi:MAG: hypothetical protein ACOYVF_07630 [Candidatus Zixiibacteriota bacterium]